jgi:hypothetical protein
LEDAGGYRIVPFQGETLDDLLNTGQIACGIGWNRKLQANNFDVINTFPFCLVTTQGHWCTVEGNRVGSYQPLQADDRIAYVEADYPINGIRSMIDSLALPQRICCTSYSSVLRHVMHGRLGLLPFHSAWLRTSYACCLSSRGISPTTSLNSKVAGYRQGRSRQTRCTE